MNILAIETSCDETAAAVVTDDGTIRSNVVSSQIDVHQATGGVVPEVASRLQMETIGTVIEQALAEAKADWPDINRIAVTYGPGLIGPLLVGVETAKALAYSKGLPLIPVNHLAGHLYSCLHGVSKLDFPYLALIVSGNHTELVIMSGHGQYEIIGSTRDDAAGEAFDKVGRLLGLPYPGGPKISKLATTGDDRAVDLPVAMANQDNFDFSFSGLKSAARRQSASAKKEDLAASFERVVVEALVRKTVRAIRAVKPTAVLLGGGVAANQRLRRELAKAIKPTTLLPTPPELATDNAAMIGLAALHQSERLTGPALFSLAADPGASLSQSPEDVPTTSA